MPRTYLVVIDDSPEARVALRFAARRAAKTNGAVEVLAVVEPQDFVQWGGVQAAIEEEQRLRIEGDRQRRRSARSSTRPGSKPTIVVRQGEPVKAVRELYRRAARTSPRWCSAPRRAGNPGPLVAHFTGNDAGKLPCPVMIIPGSLATSGWSS